MSTSLNFFIFKMLNSGRNDFTDCLLQTGKSSRLNLYCFGEVYRLEISGGFSLSLTRVNSFSRNFLFIIFGENTPFFNLMM